jgi:uncharacterized protein YbjQ (UPF0145 family)
MPTPPSLLVTTTEAVAGRPVVRTLGYVEGSKTLRPDTMAEMVSQAHRQGANAIVAVRWQEAAPGYYHVYGTAVVIQGTG